MVDQNEELAEVPPDISRWESWIARPAWARHTLIVIGSAMILTILIISIALFSVAAQTSLLPKAVIALFVEAVLYLVVYLGPGRPDASLTRKR